MSEALHHLASHDEMSDEWERVTTYYCSQVAYLAEKLDSMKEGDGWAPWIIPV